MADIGEISRALNDVESVGQARAALSLARAELATGGGLADNLSWLSSPTETEARADLAIRDGGLAGEMRLLDPFDSGDAVPAAMWTRERRQVEGAYITVQGIAGVVGALGTVSLADELARAIEDAPRLIGGVASGLGDLAGAPIAGILRGLFGQLWFWLLLAVVVFFMVRFGIPKLKLAWGV